MYDAAVPVALYSRCTYPSLKAWTRAIVTSVATSIDLLALASGRLERSGLKSPTERIAVLHRNADEIARIRVNRSAVERRAATIPARRTVKKDGR